MCGLSVFEDLEDLLNTIKKFKYLPPAVYVIRTEAIKIRKVGEIYHTPSRDSASHRTFFPCANYNPEDVWEVYREIR
ncbi:MAG: hypothetical protein N3D14_00425 [Aquificaceae bacterium]|nr:hypothetical protein [Aquificaceae bacterium]